MELVKKIKEAEAQAAKITADASSNGIAKIETAKKDNETKILTENGWKYFYDLDKDEKVMTLNASTGEKEWQKPTAYQEFDYEWN